MNRYFWFLFVVLFLIAVSSANALKLGKVTGQLQPPESKECRGMVSLWPADGHSVADPGRFNTIPPAVAQLSADCSFAIEAEPGSYYLRGIVRNSPGMSWGPLRKGDLVFMSPDGEGEVLTVELSPVVPVDVGMQSSYWVFDGFSEKVETGVSGQLVDTAGRPMEGMVVQAYVEPNMATRPLAVSAPADEMGNFRLRLAEGGNVYLQAREEIGVGLPLVGRNYGVYGEKAAEKIRVKKGKLIEGLKIIIMPRKLEKPAGS